MNSDQVKGAADNIAGKVQQAAGALGDDPKQKVEGAVREAAGKAREVYGDAVEGVREYAERKPFGALAIGVGVGVLFGLILARRRDS